MNKMFLRLLRQLRVRGRIKNNLYLNNLITHKNIQKILYKIQATKALITRKGSFNSNSNKILTRGIKITEKLILINKWSRKKNRKIKFRLYLNN